MRTKLGWTFVVMAYATGVLLMVCQPFWWYPYRVGLIATAASAAPPPPQSFFTSSSHLSLLAPEVKELFALYQRSTHLMPRPARDFLLERLQSWSDLSYDLRAETAAILRRLPRLDGHQALVYLQQQSANVMDSTAERLEIPAGWE
jgi:hypothetical protein